MLNSRSIILLVLLIGLSTAAVVILNSCLGKISECDTNAIQTGNVIFIHPDGSGPSMWAALRIYEYGPDSISNWERMQRMGLYRSHVLNSTNSSSHSGATIHSYGVKVNFDTYGNCPEKPVKSLSGKDCSIMTEAHNVGMATALINSGHICEPGTGVFVAGAEKRTMTDVISKQIIESGTDILFSGGEILLLPEGQAGRHGEPGVRKDGENMIELAVSLGYIVVYNREEMMALPSSVDKVLGVFAAEHTFNDNTEEYNKEHNLPDYNPQSPTLAEMTEVALRILDHKGRQFIMVIEEEGTDNFGNYNNAKGTFGALKRADEAIGIAMAYAERMKNTLVVTGADSDAGGMQLIPVRNSQKWDEPLPGNSSNGGPIDGINGKNTIPFTAAPDMHGTRLHFGVAWSCYDDVAGSIIVRAHGMNAHLLKNNLDNTDIYWMMYVTLFGRMLPAYNPSLDSLKY